jgi:hypothetical protein
MPIGTEGASAPRGWRLPLDDAIADIPLPLLAQIIAPLSVNSNNPACATGHPTNHVDFAMPEDNSMSAHNTRAKRGHAIRIKRFQRQFERYRRGEPVRSYETKWLAYVKEQGEDRLVCNLSCGNKIAE